MPIPSAAITTKFQSVGSLLDHLSKAIAHSIESEASVHLELPIDTSGSLVLCSGEAPGLEGLVRRQRTPLRPGEKQVPFVLVELHQTKLISEEELKDALLQDAPDALIRLTAPLKTVTLVVRTGGRANSNRLDRRMMHGIRRADSWRFDPQKHDPFEVAIQKARQRGEEESAALLEEVVADLEKTNRARRETIWWRTVLLPRCRSKKREETGEQAGFLLRLAVLQEGLIDVEKDKEARENLQVEACSYLRRSIPHIPTDGSAHMILQELMKHFTEPEDPLAIWRYIQRVAKGDLEYCDNIRREREAAPNRKESLCEDKDHAIRELESSQSVWEERDEPEGLVFEDLDLSEVYEGERKRKLPRKVLNSQHTFSIREAAHQAGVSVDFVYDSIHREKVKVQGRSGNWRMDAEALEQLKRLEKERDTRSAVRAMLLKQGKSPEAATKWIQRGLKNGQSLEQVVKSLLTDLKAAAKSRAASTANNLHEITKGAIL